MNKRYIQYIAFGILQPLLVLGVYYGVFMLTNFIINGGRDDMGTLASVFMSILFIPIIIIAVGLLLGKALRISSAFLHSSITGLGFILAILTYFYISSALGAPSFGIYVILIIFGVLFSLVGMKFSK